MKNESIITVEVSSDKGIKIGANLSIRSYFAGLAMQGLLANGQVEMVASDARDHADALIAELEREK